MKWQEREGTVQRTTDGRYCVVQANSKDWIAYCTGSLTVGKELGVRDTDLKARAVCEAEEARCRAAHRRTA